MLLYHVIIILLLQEKIKGLCLNLSALEQELDSMKPVGRDIKTVRSQLDDVNKFIKKVRS